MANPPFVFLPRRRSLGARLVLGAACLIAGVATSQTSGCTPLGWRTVPVYLDVAERVIGAVADAAQRQRVTDARERCGDLEARAAAAEDAQTAARLIRELAAAQADLAGELERLPPPAP